MTSVSRAYRHGNDTDRQSRCGDKGVWTPVNIALMVGGFIFFVPLGYVVLIGLIMGINPWQLPARIAEWFQGMRNQFETTGKSYARGKSGNHVFDEYQQTQLDRIEEIKTEVRDRDRQFKTFKTDEQRAKDRRQFDRFMGRDGQDD